MMLICFRSLVKNSTEILEISSKVAVVKFESDYLHSNAGIVFQLGLVKRKVSLAGTTYNFSNLVNPKINTPG